MDNTAVLAEIRKTCPEVERVTIHYIPPCSQIVVPVPPIPGTPYEAERDYWILKKERENPQTQVLHWQQVGPYKMIWARCDLVLVMDAPQEHA
jgi:hypothetical protein